MRLGELIAAYRKENHLSQRQFAKKCGEISNGYISMLENDFNPATNKGITPSLDKLICIASGMEMSLSELIDIADDMPVDISDLVQKNVIYYDEDDAEMCHMFIQQEKARIHEGTIVPQAENEELYELREAMRRNPNMRVLFSAAKNATPKQLKQAIEILRVLKASDDGAE